MADYYFRDDMEAEKQRQADAAQAGIATTLAPAATPSPTPPPQQANPFGDLAKAAQAVKPAAKPDYFADFKSALAEQDPFKAQAQKAVTDTLSNPTAAFDAAAKAQEDKLGREIGAEAERRRQQAVLQFGGNNTGQVDKTLNAFGNEAIMKQAELGRDIAAGRAQAAEAGRGNAVNQALGLLGENRNAAGQAASIGLQQEGQREQNQLALAGLNLDQKKFEAADANAKKGLSLEESAQALQKMGMDKDEAFKYAQLAQQKNLADQEVASREKLTYAQIGSQEKMQASSQVYEAAQKDLDRSLEKLLSNDRIAAQLQLQGLDQTFQEKMQATGFVQQKELEKMRDDLQVTLQDKGIAADVAKQIADQKFTEMMAGREQAYQATQADIQRQWATGERIDTQTWDASMQASDQKHQEILANLNSTLRLGEAQNAQAFQTAFQQMQNSFTELITKAGFTHEDAMQSAAQTFQAELQKAGFTHDEAMQGAQLAAQSMENDRNRASQELMAAASMAQQDSQFMAELQQRYSFNEGDLRLRATELGAQLKLMGLQGEQLQNAISDSKVQSAMQIAALGMEIGDGSADAMKPFVAQLGGTLEAYFKANGVDVSGSDIVDSLTPKTLKPGETPQTPKQGADAFTALMNKVGSFASPEDKEATRTYAINVANNYATAPAGQMISGVKDIVGGANMDAAGKKLLAAGISQDSLNRMVDRNEVGEFSRHAEYSATPVFIDYTLYNTLISKGMDPASAKQSLTSLLGGNQQRLGNVMTLIDFVEK